MIDMYMSLSRINYDFRKKKKQRKLVSWSTYCLARSVTFPQVRISYANPAVAFQLFPAVEGWRYLHFVSSEKKHFSL